MVIGIDASRAVTLRRTGTEAYAYFLIRALLPLAAERGYHVKLYFNQPPTQPISDAPYEAVNIPFPRLWTHLRLSAELHRNPPDLFFTPAHVIPLTYRGASIATVHDLGYHYFPAAHTKQQVRYLKWSTRHNATRSQIVLADSEATKRDLIKWYGINAAKIHTLYPGRDESLHPVTDASPVLAKYQLVSPYFLYIGTLQPRKNIAAIINAFAAVADHLPHHLVLAGKKGWLSDDALAPLATLPDHIRARIHLPGFIADKDKAALLSGATALLFPSCYEGFGFPVLEAHACSIPVITARNSSLPEVAGNAALYVRTEDRIDREFATVNTDADVLELSDAMRRVVTDDALRETLIGRGFENAQRFSWGKAAQKLINLFEIGAGSQGEISTTLTPEE